MPDRATPIAAIPISAIPGSALQTASTNCLFQTIFGFMLPFYLAGAGGDAELACAAIMQLIDAYNAATAAELDLVGRIIGFSTTAMDNLRLSMRPDLSDTKILQYRNNAISLNRVAETCRKSLEALQTKREQAGNQPPASRHALAPTTVSPPKPLPQTSTPRPAKPAEAPKSAEAAEPNGCVSAVETDPEFAFDLETMQRNAHAMLADLQARAKQLGPDAPEASIAEAVRNLGSAYPSNRHQAA